MNGGGGLEGTIHPTDTTHLTDSFTWWPQGSKDSKEKAQMLCKPLLVLYSLKFYWSKVVSRPESV